MANPGTIRTQLATRLKSINALKNVYARWPNTPIPPCAIVQRGVAEPEQTFSGGMTKWNFEVYLFVTGAAGFENAQDAVNPFLATSSTGGIFGAIDADRTLGGTVGYTFVKGIREDTDWQVAENVDFYGCVFDLEIWSS